MISAPSVSSGMPRRNRIVSACTSRAPRMRTFAGHARHCHPGVVVDEHPSTVERDFLPSVPGAQHGQALGIERVVRDLRLHVEDCVAGIELPDYARIQIAATYHLMGPTENHPHTPPRSSTNHRKRCRRHPRTASHLDHVASSLIVITRMRSHAYKGITMIRSRHATKGFSARARFGAAVTQLRNT